MPWLVTLRNVGEHFDSYSMDKGYDTKISRKDLSNPLKININIVHDIE